VVFTANVWDDEKYPYVSLMSRDNKVVRGEKTYSFFEISFAPAWKQWYADIQYEVEEFHKPSYGPYPGRMITSSYGGTECKARRIPEVLDCLRQKFDIETRVEGATMEEIERVAERVYEDAVAPKPHEIGLLEVMESNSEQVLAAIKKDITSFCTRAGVGRHVGEAGHQFAYKACTETLEGLANDLELEIPNEDWGYALEQHRVQRLFNEILVRDRESSEYEAEKVWGVLPRESYKRGEKSKAEQVAESLFEPFERGQREYLNSIGDETARKLESQRLKDAIRLFIQVYVQSMKKRVQQVR